VFRETNKLNFFAKTNSTNFSWHRKKLSKFFSSNEDHRLRRANKNIKDEEEEEGEELL